MSDPPPIFGEGPGQPDITYPAQWSYHVIGADPETLRTAVSAAIADAEHAWEGGAESRHGRWHSVRVRVLVLDEPHRMQILESLQQDEAVRLVL